MIPPSPLSPLWWRSRPIMVRKRSLCTVICPFCKDPILKGEKYRVAWTGVWGAHVRCVREGEKKDLGEHMTDEDRFWSKVEKYAGCWVWKGQVNASGYGQFYLQDGTRWYAHRYSWRLAHGPIPAGQRVLHNCDMPRCVNPSCLRLRVQKPEHRACRPENRSPPFGNPIRGASQSPPVRDLGVLPRARNQNTPDHPVVK